MGKDLSGMIEEINDASSTLSKNNKADDPVSVFSPVRLIMKLTSPVSACTGRPRTEQPSHSAAADRSRCCRITGKSQRSSKGRSKYGAIEWP